MEQSSRDERRLRMLERQSDEAPAPPVAVKRKRSKGLLVLFMVVCLVSSSVVSYYFFSYVAIAIPRELAGTWEVKEGGLKGSTLEFRLDGTTIATHFEKGEKLTQRQSVKVEGNKIILTGKDDLTGRDDTVIQTILKLTDDELVIRDEDRRVYKMVRVGK